MDNVRTFRDLDAWQIAMSVVELTYRLSADFPDGERFGLVTQMRRAAVSIPSNIAEGQVIRVADVDRDLRTFGLQTSAYGHRPTDNLLRAPAILRILPNDLPRAPQP